MVIKHIICGLFGIAAGIFTGYISMAFAQIIQGWCLPISRKPVTISMALGKMAGAFYYFFFM